MPELDGKQAVVVGASRGLGRGIAGSLSVAGASVYAIARERAGLEELKAWDPSIEVAVADATDPNLAGRVIDSRDPDILAVIAGATPLLRAIHHHTWETFSVNWQTDVRIAFHWLREALLKPLRPGSRVVIVSSGAALFGSPLSGGYAGAKASQRFIAAYAQDEAARAALGISVTAVLPRITPLTDLGRPAVRAYAARAGQSEEEYLKAFGDPLTPEGAGAACVQLIEADAATLAPAYLLTGAGLKELA